MTYKIYKCRFDGGIFWRAVILHTNIVATGKTPSIALSLLKDEAFRLIPNVFAESFLQSINHEENLGANTI